MYSEEGRSEMDGFFVAQIWGRLWDIHQKQYIAHVAIEELASGTGALLRM